MSRGTRPDPLRLVRALLAGGASTIVDVAVLALLVSAFGVSPHLASVPALALGGVVNFFGNRHFVFHAAKGSLGKQAVLYALVEAAALAANAVLFDVVLRLVALHLAGDSSALSWAYVPIRLVTSHIVFLAWSYPLWRLAFRMPRTAEAV